MTRKIALAAACAVASVSSIAFEPPAGPYLGAAASAWLFDEDRFLPQQDDDAATAGLTLGWRSAGPFALEGHYGFGDEVDAWRLEGLYFFGPRAAKTAPYLLLGYTGLAFDDEGQLADGDDTTHQLSAGLGLAHRIGEGRWEVRLEGRFLQEFGHGDRATDLGFNLGLNYYFERGAEPAPVVEAAPPPKPAPQPPETRTITVELRVLFDFRQGGGEGDLRRRAGCGGGGDEAPSGHRAGAGGATPTPSVPRRTTWICRGGAWRR
ncbi:MAG: hypothetical protein KatS3mg124_0561 [Porticoccaceae bacterium]|nr:MAG: hypothetical protein KatS3mg124_0561 [Porticoccaceae bacterium]